LATLKAYKLNQPILQAHLKAAQANVKPMLLKELAKPTQDKKKF
jgi:hypothetical protein